MTRFRGAAIAAAGALLGLGIGGCAAGAPATPSFAIAAPSASIAAVPTASGATPVSATPTASAPRPTATVSASAGLDPAAPEMCELLRDGLATLGALGPELGRAHLWAEIDIWVATQPGRGRPTGAELQAMTDVLCHEVAEETRDVLRIASLAELD